MKAKMITHAEVRPGDYLAGGIVVSQRYSASGKSVRYTFRSIATGEVREWPWESVLARTCVFELEPEFTAWGHGEYGAMPSGCRGEFRFHERIPAATVFACDQCGRHLVDFDDKEEASRQMAALAGALIERADEIEENLS